MTTEKENKHWDWLKASFQRLLQYKKIRVPNILDDYEFMDPELVESLLGAVRPLLPTDCGLDSSL